MSLVAFSASEGRWLRLTKTAKLAIATTSPRKRASRFDVGGLCLALFYAFGGLVLVGWLVSLTVLPPASLTPQLVSSQ